MADRFVLYDGPIVTSREAFNLGQSRFFNGKPCRRSHVAQRMVSNGQCVECLRLARANRRAQNYEATKAWRKANPKAKQDQDRRYQAKHPDKIAEKQRRYRLKNIEAIRESDRIAQARMRASNPEAQRRRYLSWRQRKEDRLAEAAGRPRPSLCDLCENNHGGIVFDHCHERGHFRGWLCDRCNKVLGLVKDSPKLLHKMADYLEVSHDKTHGGTPQQTSVE